MEVIGIRSIIRLYGRHVMMRDLDLAHPPGGEGFGTAVTAFSSLPT
jgi:hypothetical protein